MKTSIRNKNIYTNILIIISFIILSILEIFLIWPHNILEGNDIYFHLERIEELVKSNVLLPRFNFNSFSNNGSAVMTLYPYLLLYPFALLIKFFGHIHLIIYFMHIINAFITLLISYYSSIYLTSKKSIRYIFAIVYALSFEYISLNFWSSDFGMSWSATFMPLILFGFIYWLRHNKWLMLSIGMSLIIYSNVPMTVISLVLLFLWAIFNYKLIDKKHILSLIKAIILSLLSTAAFLLPACKLFIFNHHFIGSIITSQNANVTKITSAVHATLDPQLFFTANTWFPWELSIPAFFGLIIATLKFRHLTWLLKQFYLASLITLVISTFSFIWNSHLMFYVGGIIQTTIRLYLIPQVLLSYIFSIYIIKFINKISNNKEIINIAIAFLCLLLLQIIYINTFHSQQTHSYFHNYGITRTSFFNANNTNPSKHTDYYISTKDVANVITKDNGIINNKKKLHFITNKNRNLTFKTNSNINRLNLPILKYSKIQYKCLLDGKYIYSYTNNNLLTINNIKKGTHHLKIIMPLDKLDIFSRILTLLSIIIYIILIISYSRIRLSTTRPIN